MKSVTNILYFLMLFPVTWGNIIHAVPDGVPPSNTQLPTPTLDPSWPDADNGARFTSGTHDVSEEHKKMEGHVEKETHIPDPFGQTNPQIPSKRTHLQDRLTVYKGGLDGNFQQSEFWSPNTEVVLSEGGPGRQRTSHTPAYEGTDQGDVDVGRQVQFNVHGAGYGSLGTGWSPAGGHRQVVAPTPVPPHQPAIGQAADKNCGAVGGSVGRCLAEHHMNMPVMLLDPNRNLAAFCRNVSSVTACLVGLVEKCHGCNLNLTVTLDVFHRLRSLQCPSDCDVEGGATCIDDVMKRLLQDIIQGVNSVCESFPSWLRERVDGCILQRAGSCTFRRRDRFRTMISRMLSVVGRGCSDDGPEAVMPKIISCYKCEDKENQHVCNMQGIELCSLEEQGCFTLIEYPMKVSKGCSPPGVRPNCPPGKSCITSICSVDLCNDDDASTAAPTDPPTCQWQQAWECLTKLSGDIVRTYLERGERGDLTALCRDQVPVALNCSGEAVSRCTIATRLRVERAEWFTLQLLNGACDSQCDRALARSCVFRIKSMLDDDREDICLILDETKACVSSSTRDCSEDIKTAVNESLNEQLIRIGDQCLHPITLSADNVTITEGTEGAIISYTVNRPPSSLCRNKTCKVFFDLQLERGVSPKCDNLRSISQVVIHSVNEPLLSCSKEVLAATWREKRELRVVAKVDNQYDREQKRRLTVIMRREYPNGSSQRDPVGVVNLVIEDRDRFAACKSMSDPHITTFDTHYYHNQFEGHFYLYKHTTLPYQVQVVYQRCTDWASCACAAAVQSGDTVFVVDRCRRRSTLCPAGQHCVSIVRTTLYGWNRVTPGTRIYRKMGGRRLEVLLPHGTLVKIDSRRQHLDIWITPSPYDVGRTRGLCGIYDGWRGNDLTMPNGTIYDGYGKGKGQQPTPFCKAWRVASADRILHGVVEKPYNPPVYCECHATSGDKNAACSADILVETCDYDEDAEITNRIQLIRPLEVLSSFRLVPVPYRYPIHAASPTHHRGIRHPDDEIILEHDWTPKEKSWPSGRWTEAKAWERCEHDIPEKYIASRRCLQELGHVLRLDYYNEVLSCVEDIKLSEGPEWIMSSVDAFVMQCQEEMKRDTSFLENNRQRARNLRGIICMNMCSGQGTCRQGVCKCEAGYTGEDCSLLSTAVPSSTELPDKGLCDLRTTDCSRAEAYSMDVINTPGLCCIIQEVTVSSEGTHSNGSNLQVVPAAFVTFNQVKCTLPRNASYWVAVSNNRGRNSSVPRLHVVYHSDCMVCQSNIARRNARCYRKKGSCIISDGCYPAGAENPMDKCEVCKPEASPSQWYYNRQNPACNSQAGNIAAVVAPFFVVLCTGTLLAALMYKRKKRLRQRRVTPQEASEISVTDATDVPPLSVAETAAEAMTASTLITSAAPVTSAQSTSVHVVLDLRRSQGHTPAPRQEVAPQTGSELGAPSRGGDPGN